MTRNQLPLRVAVFFAANPDEMLTTDDVVAKFGTPRVSARCGLHRMAKEGLLSRVADEEDRRLCSYAAGPELRRMIGAQ